MHDFDTDFYGHDMRAVVLGYIRPELDYTSRGKSCSSSHADRCLLGSARGANRGY